jgi:hypothetical protein
MTGSGWIVGETRETRVATLAGNDSLAWHQQAEAEGHVELELTRAPDRCDTRVARACGTSVLVVRRVRERLGVYPTRPA